jgi:hypothetical protein
MDRPHYITIADIFDGQATSLVWRHLPEPKGKSCLFGSTIFGISGAHKWNGAELWKRHIWVMTFPLSLSSDMRLRLIEINYMLLAVLKCWAQQKRHTYLLPTRRLGWAPIQHDAGSKYKTYSENPDEQLKWTNERKKTYGQNSRLEEPQLHHNHEKIEVFHCAVALCTIQNA